MRGSKAKRLRRVALDALRAWRIDRRNELVPLEIRGKAVESTVRPRLVGHCPNGKPILVPFRITPTLVNRPLSKREHYRWYKKLAKTGS
tara:strand:- start:579 stop:845 length:267 start_codon:yes stop_codon:yes gene_type:complete